MDGVRELNRYSTGLQKYLSKGTEISYKLDNNWECIMYIFIKLFKAHFLTDFNMKYSQYGTSRNVHIPIGANRISKVYSQRQYMAY
jgi:hypothetical protein